VRRRNPRRHRERGRRHGAEGYLLVPHGDDGETGSETLGEERREASWSWRKVRKKSLVVGGPWEERKDRVGISATGRKRIGKAKWAVTFGLLGPTGPARTLYGPARVTIAAVEYKISFFLPFS